MPTELIPTEAQEQTKFVVWMTKRGYKLAASANGGSRNLLEAMALKRTGVSPGFPDVFVPLPIGPYHGFFVEMKRKKGGKVSPQQVEWLNYLRNHGYYAEVARGFEEARDMFLAYLKFAPEVA